MHMSQSERDADELELLERAARAGPAGQEGASSRRLNGN